MAKEPANLEQIAATEREAQEALRARLYCCASTACLSSGTGEVMEAVTQTLESHGIAEQVQIVPTGCMGLCSLGPLLRVEVTGQTPVLYKEMTPLTVRLVLAEHVVRALEAPEGEPFEVPKFLDEFILPLDLPFFAKQQRIVLENNGRLDPNRIEEYIARGGYRAAEKALKTMDPQEVIDAISASGLRGRGGGGFPTGTKWGFCRGAAGDEKFIICNGDEGDPGAYMDRSILEGDPHAVIEGMLIAAYAVGASSGWFYIRAEYPLAVERVRAAIKQCRRHGLIGKDVLGTGFVFDCEVRLGAGAFVCGEETALIHSIEGQRGTPRPRPPYPSVRGLWGKPTVVNNVETLANVAPILNRGAEWFAGIGAGESKGTKVFALTGKVEHSGLIEVPMGMPLREVVEQIGGGSSTGKPVKAVQTGGPSGGVIPAAELDVPICYETLKDLGSMMGSGGMIVMDVEDSMLDIAAFYLGFIVEESCGKCTPCRIGGAQMLTLIERIRDGEGTPDDLINLKRLALATQRASLCGLGQTAPNPVISTLNYFPEEYTDALVRDGAEAPGWVPAPVREVTQ